MTLRCGLISAGASLIALLLLTVIVWVFLVDRLEARVENSLITRHEVSVKNNNTFSDQERELFQRFRQSLPIRDEGVFAWINAEGDVFASNASGLECRDDFYDGWLDVSPSSVVQKPALLFDNQDKPLLYDRFRFLARERDDNCLVFGRSMYEVDALRKSVLGLFVWLVPLCLLPALLISLSQSWKLRRRLRRMSDAVQVLSKGNLDARIPVDGEDDIDRLGKSANRSFERLQESVNALKQLTSIMAHDLRAPLNRISIPLDKALQANEAGKTAVEPLREVEAGLVDARSIFDALLRISQIESGRRQSSFSDINLFDIVESLYEIYQPVVEDADRTLEFEITGEGSAMIRGDVDLIRQAIVNLIENAARYTPEGSLIRIGVLRDSKYSSVFVKDNGPGVPASERPRVLQRLYRYEASTSGHSGHGLGLSLVKAVVELHSGEIVLDDAKPGLLVVMRFDTIE